MANKSTPRSSDPYYYKQVDQEKLKKTIDHLDFLGGGKVEYSQVFIEKGTDWEREFFVTVSLARNFQSYDVSRSPSGRIFLDGYQAICDVANGL